jgi:hypothetical protein
VATDRGLSWDSIKIPTLNDIKREGTAAVEKYLGSIVTVFSPFVGLFLSDVYITPMEKQLYDGRAKSLPNWLLTYLSGAYTNIDINKVRYGENIHMYTLERNTCMTIGYDIFCPYNLHLDLDDLPSRTFDFDRWQEFASNVQTIMHEIEHTSQFFKAGGDRHAWVTKYVAQSGMFLKINPSDSHDYLPLEKDAEAKSWSLYAEAFKWFSRGRTTPLGTLYPGVRLDLPMTLQEGMGLQSPDGRYVFRVQSDGNLVIYAPGNKPVWQSYTSGKACPPFKLTSTDSLRLNAYTFQAFDEGFTPLETTIWRTTPYKTPGYYLIDPFWQSNAMILVVTNWGQLQVQLTYADRREPTVIWTTAMAPFIPETIESTTVILPAVQHYAGGVGGMGMVTVAGAYSNPGMGY